MNTKHIAELVRNLADTYDSSYPEGRNQRHDSLMEIANELDQPAPRPLLADAEVGWVCRRRDGKWVQLTKTDRDVIHDGESYPYEYVLGSRWYVNVNGYWNISAGTHPADIVSCEPLAPEGTAEWAVQIMKLGYKVTKRHLSRTYWQYDASPHLKCISEYNCGTLQIMVLPEIWLTTAEPTGWQLYEPKPEPLLSDAKVGDICKRRDGKWVQICEVHGNSVFKYPNPIKHTHIIICDETGDTEHWGKVEDADIISCEPLAPIGSAEWALQQMKLGKTVCHPIDDKPHRCRITDDKIVCDYCGQVFDIAKWTSGCLQPSGWCIYEPAKPEPAPFSVGDWVEHNSGSHHKVLQISKDGRRFRISNYEFPWFENDGWEEPDGRTRNSRIVRKLDPSEVRVKITLEGTVHKIDGNNLAFELEDERGVVTCVGYQQLDPDTAKLVRELVDK